MKRTEWRHHAWVVYALLASFLLFPATAPAATMGTELTDANADDVSRVVIMSPASRSSVKTGDTLNIVVALKKPLEGYNGIKVWLAPVTPSIPQPAPNVYSPTGSYRLTAAQIPLYAKEQKDGTYLATYKVPVNYTGLLWLMPEDDGSGMFGGTFVGRFVLVEVKSRVVEP